MGADHNVRKYLGLTLVPQAGVAIGMAQKIANTPELASVSSAIVTVTLCATLVYELIGPLLTKWALVKAGEITIEKKNKKGGNGGSDSSGGGSSSDESKQPAQVSAQ